MSNEGEILSAYLQRLEAEREAIREALDKAGVPRKPQSLVERVGWLAKWKKIRSQWADEIPDPTDMKAWYEVAPDPLPLRGPVVGHLSDGRPLRAVARATGRPAVLVCPECRTDGSVSGPAVGTLTCAKCGWTGNPELLLCAPPAGEHEDVVTASLTASPLDSGIPIGVAKHDIKAGESLGWFVRTVDGRIVPTPDNPHARPLRPDEAFTPQYPGEPFDPWANCCKTCGHRESLHSGQRGWCKGLHDPCDCDEFVPRTNEKPRCAEPLLMGGSCELEAGHDGDCVQHVWSATNEHGSASVEVEGPGEFEVEWSARTHGTRIGDLWLEKGGEVIPGTIESSGRRKVAPWPRIVTLSLGPRTVAVVSDAADYRSSITVRRLK